jgi:hypothetical protein
MSHNRKKTVIPAQSGSSRICLNRRLDLHACPVGGLAAQAAHLRFSISKNHGGQIG